jgi:hypothetical protein
MLQNHGRPSALTYYRGRHHEQHLRNRNAPAGRGHNRSFDGGIRSAEPDDNLAVCQRQLAVTWEPTLAWLGA